MFSLHRSDICLFIIGITLHAHAVTAISRREDAPVRPRRERRVSKPVLVKKGGGGGKRNAGDANSARAERASESLVHEVIIIKCLHRAGGTADHVLYIRFSKHAAAAASEPCAPPLGGAHIDHGPQQQHTPSSERASLLFVLSLAGKRGGAGGQWGRVLRVVHDCVISHVRAVPSTTSSVLCIRLVRQRRASY